MFPTHLIVYFKTLPEPVQWTTYFYLGSILVYNTVMIYLDCKEELVRYRNKIPSPIVENMYCINGKYESPKSEWEAVCWGARKHAYKHFWKSLIWPITSIQKIIPMVVLALNPNPTSGTGKHQEDQGKDKET